MNTKKYLGALAVIVTLASVGTALQVNAQSNPNTPTQNTGMYHKGMGPGMMGRNAMKPTAIGTVTAVNGSVLTISSKGPANSTATTYTVDATNAKITKNRTTGTVSSIVVGDNVMVMGTLSGTNITATAINDGMMMRSGLALGQGQNMMHGGVFGTVSAISGNSITLTSKQFQPKESENTTTTPASITYTVDATNATVTKSGATSSVSAIVVGDQLMVQGTVSGTTVAATKINDGMGMDNKAGGMQNIPAGNGQPIVGGTISAISGSIITITNSAGVTFTVDATSAKFSKTGVASPTISNVTVGDIIIAQGTVSGSNVTANSVIDNGSAPTSNSNQQNTNSVVPQQSKPGFFGAIGGFFKHIFGF